MVSWGPRGNGWLVPQSCAVERVLSQGYEMIRNDGKNVFFLPKHTCACICEFGPSPLPRLPLPRVPDWAPLLVAPGSPAPGPCRAGFPLGKGGMGGVGGGRVWELSRRPPGHPQLAPAPANTWVGLCLRRPMSCPEPRSWFFARDGPGQPDHPLPAWSSPGARVGALSACLSPEAQGLSTPKGSARPLQLSSATFPAGLSGGQAQEGVS